MADEPGGSYEQAHASGILRAELKAELESLRSQLKLMTVIFAGCVALATAVAGHIFTQIVQFAGPISRIPIIEETAKRLEGKTNDLMVGVGQIKTQLGYALNDLESVKAAVKAVDVRSIPASSKPTEYAFPKWRGVAITDVRPVSTFLVKSRPESGTAWIYSTNPNLINAVSNAQLAPSKFELDPNAFLGWSSWLVGNSNY